MKTEVVESIMQSMQQLLDSIISTQSVDKTDIKNALALSAAIRELAGDVPDIREAACCGDCEYSYVGTVAPSVSRKHALICRKHHVEVEQSNICDHYEKEPQPAVYLSSRNGI